MKSMKNNKNAEKWNEEDSINLFNEAIELTELDSDYDFIGEVAKNLGTYRDVFTYLKNKFKSCEHLHKILTSNLEANCFSHGKKGDINTAMAIVNLKSNHGWTDRVDNTSKGNEIQGEKVIINFKKKK